MEGVIVVVVVVVVVLMDCMVEQYSVLSTQYS